VGENLRGEISERSEERFKMKGDYSENGT